MTERFGAWTRGTALWLALAFAGGVLIHFTQFPGTWGSENRRTTIMQHVDSAALFHRGDAYIANGMLYEVLNAAYRAGYSRYTAMALLMGLCTAVTWYATFVFARWRAGAGYSAAGIARIALLTMIVNALWIPVLSPRVYLGKWGPNVYHNPSHTLVMAFAVPLFIAIGYQLARDREKVRPWVIAAIGVGLTVSIYAKPTFFIPLAPATVLYGLMVLGVSRRAVVLLTALLILPTIYLLIVQHFAFTLSASRLTGRTNEIAPFLVWDIHAENVTASLAMTFAFPAVLVGCAVRGYRFGGHLAYAWMLSLVATVMAALLVEVTGAREVDLSANWFSGYLIANHLLFMVSIVEFFRWRVELGPEGRTRWPYRACVVLLGWHTISGVVYLTRMVFMHGAYA